MDLFIRALKMPFGIVRSIAGGRFGLFLGSPSAAEGPRASLPPDYLPDFYRGIWSGTVADDSPNTFGRGYGVRLDLVGWISKTDPTGPGHRGATGRLRLVAVRPDEIDVEEDVTSGASIEHSVDGVYTLRTGAGGELLAQWRSQYPSRDVYVGHGTLRRVH